MAISSSSPASSRPLASERPLLGALLQRPEVVQELREAFRRTQDNFTTTIRDAAELSGLTEAQLRYAETRGLLTPDRTSQNVDHGGRLRGQRRYSVDELFRAHLIHYLLTQDYNLSEISTFISNSPHTIDSLRAGTAPGLRAMRDRADMAQFRRFFLPRALHFVLALIFENEDVSDVGVILPVWEPGDTERVRRLKTMQPIEALEQVSDLGRILVAWRVGGRPLTAFVTQGNPFERTQHVYLRAFHALEAVGSDPTGMSFPLGAYIAYEENAEEYLTDASRMASQRERRQRDHAGPPKVANPRAVAGRLLRYIQTGDGGESGPIWASSPNEGDLTLFDTPSRSNVGAGDPLLTKLADTVVALGAGSHAPQATPTGATPWRFCCVLVPKPEAPAGKQQELLVVAQSADGPHRVGVTTTSQAGPGGLTIQAFTNRQVAQRPHILPADPHVAYVDEEKPISSAVALPALGVSGPPVGVIYVASAYETAFNQDDILLLRVMGRMVAEIEQTLQARMRPRSVLTDALANPELLNDTFGSDVAFHGDLKRILTAFRSASAASGQRVGAGRRRENERQEREEALDESPFFNADLPLTLMALDFNDFERILRRYGDEAAQALTRLIGKRLKVSRAFGLQSNQLRLYRILGDRFFLIARPLSVDEARRGARSLLSEAQAPYQLPPDRLDPHSAIEEPITLTARLAQITLGPGEVGEMVQVGASQLDTLAYQLMTQLDSAIEQAKPELDERGRPKELAVMWHPQERRFIPDHLFAPSIASAPFGASLPPARLAAALAPQWAYGGDDAQGDTPTGAAEAARGGYASFDD